MRAWFRLMIVWLVALAFPVQSMAGVSMTHCGQGQARVQAAQAPSAVHAAPGHVHGAAQGAAAHHHEAVADLAAQAMPDHHGAPDASKLTDPGSGNAKCSACASCCAGLALLSVMPPLAAPLAGATVFDTVVPTVEVFAGDGPDRPPRSPGA